MSIDIGKGVCIHASSVSFLGKAIIFLGHSRSGKSTISELLGRNYQKIADDKVWASKSDRGIWMIRDCTYGFLGDKIDANRIGTDLFPLFAVMRIYKGDRNKISMISQRETAKHLLDAVFEIELQKKNPYIRKRKEWFRMIADISRNTKGYVLTFKKDYSISIFIQECFFLHNKERGNEKAEI